MRAFVLYEGDRVRLISPYVREFVESMKALIPHRFREWRADENCWLIARSYEPELRSVAEQFYDSVELLITAEEADERVTRALASERELTHKTWKDCVRQMRNAFPHHYALGLFPGLDNPSLIQAMYRAGAKLVHPDIAGPSTHADMVRLNQARDALLHGLKGTAA